MKPLAKIELGNWSACWISVCDPGNQQKLRFEGSHKGLVELWRQAGKPVSIEFDSGAQKSLRAADKHHSRVQKLGALDPGNDSNDGVLKR